MVTFSRTKELFYQLMWLLIVKSMERPKLLKWLYALNATHLRLLKTYYATLSSAVQFIEMSIYFLCVKSFHTKYFKNIFSFMFWDTKSFIRLRQRIHVAISNSAPKHKQGISRHCRDATVSKVGQLVPHLEA